MAITAGYNPSQARDRKGRWIEMGANVRYKLSGGREGVGIVIGFSNDGSGVSVRDSKSKRDFFSAARSIEVMDVQARIPQPGEKHPEVVRIEAAKAEKIAASPLKEMVDANGDTVQVGEKIGWTHDIYGSERDTLVTINPDGTLAVMGDDGANRSLPAESKIKKLIPDVTDPLSVKTAAELTEAARWAGYSNDGYDKNASGIEAGLSTGAKMVIKRGVSAEVAAELRTRAAEAATRNDTAGYADFNPFHTGHAKGLTQAAEKIEKALTLMEDGDPPAVPPTTASGALGKSLSLAERQALRSRVHGSVLTAAFNPRQPRDSKGRWIEIGATVTFRPLGRPSAKLGKVEKKSGTVTGVTEDGLFEVKETSTGELQVIEGNQLEVVDVVARLDEDPVDTPEDATGPGQGFWPENVPAVEDVVVRSREDGERLNTSWEVASRLLERYAPMEASVTPELMAAATAAGGEMSGLEYKFKTQDSLTRKIYSNAPIKGLTPEEFSNKLGDALRYTMVTPPDQLAAAAQAVLDDYRRRGYTVSVSNTWDVPSTTYKGVNTNISKDGLIFEVQFHSPESFEIKNVQHDLYNIARSDKYSVDQRVAAEKQMQANMKTLAHPIGIETVS